MLKILYNLESCFLWEKQCFLRYRNQNSEKNSFSNFLKEKFPKDWNSKTLEFNFYTTFPVKNITKVREVVRFSFVSFNVFSFYFWKNLVVRNKTLTTNSFSRKKSVEAAPNICNAKRFDCSVQGSKLQNEKFSRFWNIFSLQKRGRDFAAEKPFVKPQQYYCKVVPPVSST